MPTYTITDPNTGRKLKVTGDSPPTEQELEELFAGAGEASAPPPTLDVVSPNETDNPWEAAKQGFKEGAMDAGGRVLASGGRAFLSALNPINTLKTIADFNPMDLGRRMGEDLMQGAPQGRAALSSMVEGAKNLNPADPDAPEAWGAIGGNLAAMKAAPALIKGAPGAIESTGNVMQKVGWATSGRANLGIGGLTFAMGHPGVAAAEILGPPALRVAGRGVSAVGRMLKPGIEAPAASPTPAPPTAAPAVEAVADQLGLPKSPQVPMGPNSLTPGPVESVAEQFLTPPPEAATLGTPRVISWKPGAGPSPADVAALRAVEGSKAAARRLKIPVSQVKAMTPSSDVPRLPTAAQDRIRARVASLSDPTQLQAYLDAAPNDTTRRFIESLMKIR